MRVDHRWGLVCVLCAFAALVACGREPIGNQKSDAAADAADGGRRADATGAGAAGKTGAAGTGGSTGAAGIGAAGTSAAAGNTGAAGTNAMACSPGETICTGPSQAVACLPTGVWSTDNRFCSYGCMKTVCRECAPGDTICNSPATIQRCSADGLRWAAPEPCENGCEGGACAPPCQPGSSECVTNTDVRTCRGDGLWGALVSCKAGCSSGACRECEPYTYACLTPKSTRQCQFDATWGNPITCADACSGGICTDCKPDTGMCVDEKTMRGCTSSGTWDPPTPCGDGVCFGSTCHSCKPGSIQCGESDLGATVQTCSDDGQWLDTMTCANTCKANTCTSNPKKVFVTSTTYKAGDLGGLAGADAKCQARARAAALTGTFRAWLSDATASPSSRFSRDAGPYLLVNGGLVATSWLGLTSGTLRHAINITELGTAAPTATIPDCTTPIVWTNTGTDGMLADFGSTCGDWTDSSVFSVWLGTTSSQVDWTASACSNLTGTSAATGCGALAPIYCFEQ
jgi:hypothetical protein